VLLLSTPGCLMNVMGQQPISKQPNGMLRCLVFWASATTATATATAQISVGPIPPCFGPCSPQ
jgi:hypothetical protein